MALTTQEFLEICLARAPTVSEVQSVQTPSQAPEDLWFDRKSGLLLTESAKDRRHKIQRHVSGFANAEGGVLLVGVDNAGVIDGVQPVGGASPADYAARVLSDLAGYLHPSPRIWTVAVGSLEVLIVAMPRIGGLCPCIESGRVLYFRRLGDSTVPVDPYLLADLMLGRRQRPELVLRVDDVRLAAADTLLRIPVELSFVNESLAWARDIEIAVVCCAAHVRSVVRAKRTDRDGYFTFARQPVGARIQSSIDVIDAALSAPQLQEPALTVLRFEPEVRQPLPPLAQTTVTVPLLIARFVFGSGRQNVRYRSAVVAVPDGGLPRWWQLDIEMDAHTVSRPTRFEAVPVRDDGRAQVGSVWI